jgi:hypothetical protein
VCVCMWYVRVMSALVCKCVCEYMNCVTIVKFTSCAYVALCMCVYVYMLLVHDLDPQ